MTLQTVAVLRVLLDDPLGEHYGLEIAKAAELPSVSLYPILARLERERWVASDWEQIDEHEAGRRRRRYYRLTANGAAWAEQRWAPPWSGFPRNPCPRRGRPGRRTVSTLAFLVTAVLVPMLVNEFTDWQPWFAARLIRLAVRALPSKVRPRYAEEWLAELDAVPGNLSKLALAVRIFVGAPGTAAAVGDRLPLKAVAVKALLDKALAGATLILLSPLLVAIMISIKITDGGPIFSRQIRVGKDGRTFPLWKFDHQSAAYAIGVPGRLGGQHRPRADHGHVAG